MRTTFYSIAVFPGCWEIEFFTDTFSVLACGFSECCPLTVEIPGDKPKSIDRTSGHWSVALEHNPCRIQIFDYRDFVVKRKKKREKKSRICAYAFIYSTF